MGRQPGSCLRHLPRVPAPLEGHLLSSSHRAQETLMICAPTVCQASVRPCLGGASAWGGADTTWTSQSTGLWSLGEVTLR